MTSDFIQDLKKYGGVRSFFREQSIYVILVYRFGRLIEKIKPRFLKRIISIPYYIIFRVTETVFATSIPKEAKIGAGLRVWHFGQIFINGETVIGKDCILRQGVTIGSKSEGGKSPVIGDNVEFGANSTVVGDITIGSNCKIGAMSLVMVDVPDNSIAVGIPAKIKPLNKK